LSVNAPCRGAFIRLPPRARTTKVVLPLLYTVAFVVRGNESHLPVNAPWRGAVTGLPVGRDYSVSIGRLAVVGFPWRGWLLISIA